MNLKNKFNEIKSIYPGVKSYTKTQHLGFVVMNIAIDPCDELSKEVTNQLSKLEDVVKVVPLKFHTPQIRAIHLYMIDRSFQIETPIHVVMMMLMPIVGVITSREYSIRYLKDSIRIDLLNKLSDGVKQKLSNELSNKCINVKFVDNVRDERYGEVGYSSIVIL